MNQAELVDAILEEVKHFITENSRPGAILATWNAEESVDSNLSEISFPDGSVLNGIPKAAHVTGLTAGDVVICMNHESNLPLMIIGKLVGDISLLGG